jgi:hypothetical protein
MHREILDQIIDEIIKNDRRGGLLPALRKQELRTGEAAWNAWVPEIARKSPLDALASLGSGWSGLAEPAVQERLSTWGPNRQPLAARRPRGLAGWFSRWSRGRVDPGPTCVIRAREPGGRSQWVASDQLAPGDLVLLSAGEIVPADVRLLRVREFRVDERILTGNGRPVAKAAQWDKTGSGPFGITDLAYGGTRVVGGTATGVVVATGDGMLLAILGQA